MDSIGGIQYCITIVGKCVFDRNFPFDIPLNLKLFRTSELIKINQNEAMVKKEYENMLGSFQQTKMSFSRNKINYIMFHV